MLAERGGSPNQCIRALDRELSGEPGPFQHPRLRPRRRSKVMLRAEIFGKRSQQDIPSLITDGWWLIEEERNLALGAFPVASLRR